MWFTGQPRDVVGIVTCIGAYLFGHPAVGRGIFESPREKQGSLEDLQANHSRLQDVVYTYRYTCILLCEWGNMEI